jgi:hypothetical protein
MKDNFLLKGVVSAYDAKTGKVLFQNLHNVVTAVEKVYVLNRLIGNTTIGDNFFNNEDSDIQTAVSGIISGSAKIAKFKVGTVGNNTYPVEYEDTVTSMLSNAFDVDFFSSNDSYQPADIADDMKGKKIIYTRDGGAFIRFKLQVVGNGEGNSLGISAGECHEVNFVTLLDDSANANRVTQFRFPGIPFYADTSVIFEYRLYL